MRIAWVILRATIPHQRSKFNPLVARGAFGLPFGDHPLFLVPVVLALAAVAGCLSLLVGVLCNTEKQVILPAIFGAMGLSALGGCWWPIETVPETFKTIATLKSLRPPDLVEVD
jgi:ABC-type multidrug transport system permease subunit